MWCSLSFTGWPSEENTSAEPIYKLNVNCTYLYTHIQYIVLFTFIPLYYWFWCANDLADQFYSLSKLCWIVSKMLLKARGTCKYKQRGVEKMQSFHEVKTDLFISVLSCVLTYSKRAVCCAAAGLLDLWAKRGGGGLIELAEWFFSPFPGARAKDQMTCHLLPLYPLHQYHSTVKKANVFGMDVKWTAVISAAMLYKILHMQCPLHESSNAR